MSFSSKKVMIPIDHYEVEPFIETFLKQEIETSSSQKSIERSFLDYCPSVQFTFITSYQFTSSIYFYVGSPEPFSSDVHLSTYKNVSDFLQSVPLKEKKTKKKVLRTFF